MQSKCKIYVAKRVWDDHSVRLRDLEPGAAKHSREEAAHTAEALSGTAALTTLRCGMINAARAQGQGTRLCSPCVNLLP